MDSNQNHPADTSQVLMVTTVPFWNRDTGAQQRIHSLTRFLISRGHQLVVFYLHDLSKKQQKSLAGYPFQVVPLAPDSSGLLQKPKSLVRSMLPGKLSATSGPRDGPLTHVADDFRWPAAKSQFLKLVTDLNPALVIVEYVALSCYAEYVKEVLGSRAQVVLDAHDVMFQRCQRFEDQQSKNWLQIDRQQESELVSQFDAVLAIQQDEANTFREMAPQVDVILAGHCPDMTDPRILSGKAERNSDETVVGFLGSDNQPNLLAAKWILNNVWPVVAKRLPGKVRLLLVGGFTDSLDLDALNLESDTKQSIKTYAQFKQIWLFYDLVDIVINPVDLGTGLKIKNVEALMYGKPLVSTTHSATGLPPSLIQEIQIADAAEHFASAIIALASDPEYCRRQSQKLSEMARAEFSESTVYASFANWLDQRRILANT